MAVIRANELHRLGAAGESFDTILHPLRMALDGKNDHLARQAIHVRVDWVLKILFRACLKTALWCGSEMIKRAWYDLIQGLSEVGK